VAAISILNLSGSFEICSIIDPFCHIYS